MTSLEMRNLIFEALAEKNPEKTPWKKTFEMYGYRGTVSALRALVEYIGIEHGVIEKVVEIPTMAWGVQGEYTYYLSLSLIHISEHTRLLRISYADFCL